MTRLAVVIVLIGCCCLAARTRASAIPMWEFLTREEKMSHIYRIFSQEVAQHCKDSSMPDCNKNFLVAGLKNLAELDDDRLDEMDPYQRGAKDIIWRAIVGGGSNRQTGSRLGQHHYHEDDPLAVGDNQLAQESIASHDYARPADHPGPYLSGPMVIRVYPDGRPVPSDAQPPLPKDEDIEDIRYTARLPSLKELEKPAAAATTTTKLPASSYHPPTREMLPPLRKSYRASYFRYSPPARYYTRNNIQRDWFY